VVAAGILLVGSSSSARHDDLDDTHDYDNEPHVLEGKAALLAVFLFAKRERRERREERRVSTLTKS